VLENTIVLPRDQTLELKVLQELKGVTYGTSDAGSLCPVACAVPRRRKFEMLPWLEAQAFSRWSRWWCRRCGSRR